MIPPFVTVPPTVNVATYSIGADVATNDLNLNKSFTWTKPPGVAMVFIWIVAPGANGRTTPNSTSTGGGGGSGGPFGCYLLPAMFIPDTLVITAGNTNTRGVRVIEPVSNYTILNFPSGIVPTGQTGGGATAVGTEAMFITGPRTTISGTAGSSGGASGNAGVNVTGRTSFNSGGAGGGGATSGTGGAVLVPTEYSAYPVLTSAAVGTNGANGYQFLTQLAFTSPGAGGGGGPNSVIFGGAGGAGGLGCGGGGGGGNNFSAGPSPGGVGGPGLVIIYSW